MKARKRQILKLSLMIAFTFTFFLTEVICGHITGSLALIGDSYHMISDVVALVIGLSCVMISTKSSKQNTFGWARAEILGALFNSIFLSTLCFTIFIEAIERLFHPHEIHEPDMLLVVGCVGLAVNLLGMVMFCNEAHGHSHDVRPNSEGRPSRLKPSSGPSVPASRPTEDIVGNGTYAIISEVKVGEGFVDAVETEFQKDCLELGPAKDLVKQRADLLGLSSESPDETKIRSSSDKKKSAYSAGQMNIRGVFLHILGDALGSVVVIVSALIVKFCEGSWTLRVDPVLSLVMICIILSTTFPLLKQSSLILLQHAPGHIVPSELCNRLSSQVAPSFLNLDPFNVQIPGLLGVHELHVWQLVGNKNVASMHIKCSDSDSYETAAEKIRRLLHEEGIHSTTIQPEFVKDFVGTGSGECTMECRPDESCSEDRCCSTIRKRTPVVEV